MTSALQNRGGNNSDLPLLLSEVVKLVQPMFPLCFLDHAARRESQVIGRLVAQICNGSAPVIRIVIGLRRAYKQHRHAESMEQSMAGGGVGHGSCRPYRMTKRRGGGGWFTKRHNVISVAERSIKSILSVAAWNCTA